MSLPIMHVWPIAPSSSFSAEKYEAGLKVLQSLNCVVDRTMPLRKNTISYLNGSDDERLFELEKSLASKKHQVVWAVRGGYGMTRLLPLLKVPKNLKRPVLIGFSDASALMLHLWASKKIKSLHAPVITRLADEPKETLDALSLILRGQTQNVYYPSFTTYVAPKEKCIEGTLIPINLCILTHLVGTSSMPNLSDAILILEEVSEAPYRIDRMLTQLWASGVLKNVKAVIVGYLTACEPKQEALEVFVRVLTSLGISVFGRIPVGHESPNWPIPFGVQARIECMKKEASLKILDNIFVPEGK